MFGMARNCTIGNCASLFRWALVNVFFSCSYRGFSILNVIMEDLNTNRNLQQATDVVLTGCSGNDNYSSVILATWTLLQS